MTTVNVTLVYTHAMTCTYNSLLNHFRGFFLDFLFIHWFFNPSSILLARHCGMTDSFVQCAHWCVYIRESVTPSAGSAPPLNEVSFLSPSSSSSSCGFTPAASLQTSAKGHCVTLLLLVNDTLSPPQFSATPWRKRRILRRGWTISLWQGRRQRVFHYQPQPRESALRVRPQFSILYSHTI